MSSLLSLIQFEYKKIVKRKSFIFAVLLMLFMSTFCVVAPVLMGGLRSENNGPPRTNLEHMRIQQKANHDVSGYFDDNMINDIIEKNAIAGEFLIDGDTYPADIYEECILPYRGIRWNMISVFSPLRGDYEAFGNLKSSEGIDFYALRDEGIEARLKQTGCSQAEIDTTMSKTSSISRPFYFDFFESYSMFLSTMSTSAAFIIFALAICVAPIFSEEYEKKTDAIILSSKFGKNKLITAKIITTVTFSFLFTITALIIALMTTFSIYPTIGGNVSFQMFEIFTVYPLTMATAMFIFCLMIICAALLVSALCTLLSSYFSTFGTIIATLLLLVGGLFIHIPIESLRIINYFLPAKMMDFRYIFSERLVCVFGMYVEPYIFIPILCFALLAVLLPLAYRGFKNHQVG